MRSYVIGFYGYSNTGKTNVISDLIKKLNEEEHRVAVIKCSDKKISFDKEEKDTYKHSKAGANPVVLSSLLETDFIIKKNLSIDDIINYLTVLEKLDIILVEGANDKNLLKVCIGDIQKRENTIMEYDGDFEKLYNFIKGKMMENKNG